MNDRNDRRTGALRKTTPRQDWALVRASERNRFIKQHRRHLITEGTRLPASTIKRRLKESSLNGRVARKKPFIISVVNAQARLNYAFSKRHRRADQCIAAQERGVLFCFYRCDVCIIIITLRSDESPFSIFPNCGKVYVLRPHGEKFQCQCLKPTVKHGGGSVVVWGRVTVADLCGVFY